MTLEVFDPAMCCSTGVCGPTVDPSLAAFAGDLQWLESRGVDVRRYNLGQEPGVFATRDDVRQLLTDRGQSVLPIVIADGDVRATGRYPGRTELGLWAGLDPLTEQSPPPALSMEVIAELAGVGAAVGSNCEPCLRYHYDKARALGLTTEHLTVAVQTAQMVKDAPAAKILGLAARLLQIDVAALHRAPVPDAPAPARPAPSATSAETPCCGGGSGSQGASDPLTIGAVPSGSACC